MFQNARIVCTNADLDNYHTQDSKPGEPNFVMSSGTLSDFYACPARWIAGYRHGGGSLKRWRQLVQCRHLTPKRYPDLFAVRPDTYQVRVLECPSCKSQSDALICRKCGLRRATQLLEKPWAGGADFCKKWSAAAEQRHQTVVRAQEHADAQTAADRLEADPAIASFRDASDILMWLVAEWTDADTGLTVPVRTVVPYVPRKGSAWDNSLGALKITRDASHALWRRQCYYGNSHLRAAWCLDLYAAATGEPRPKFYFVLSENVAPFEPARRTLSPMFLQLGRRTYQTMLASYCQCLSTRTWPSYDLSTAGPDAWTMVETEPWMHQGEGTSLGAPAAVTADSPDGDPHPAADPA